jgi:hypothetical protein
VLVGGPPIGRATGRVHADLARSVRRRIKLYAAAANVRTPAHASNKVSSTVKCSSESSPASIALERYIPPYALALVYCGLK